MKNKYTNNDLLKMDKMRNIMKAYNIDSNIIDTTVLDIFNKRYLINIEHQRPNEYYTSQDIRRIWKNSARNTDSQILIWRR